VPPASTPPGMPGTHPPNSLVGVTSTGVSPQYYYVFSDIADQHWLPSVRSASSRCYQFCCLVNRGTMGVNSWPKTVTRQRRGCDLNPGPTAPESSPLTTRLPSHPVETTSCGVMFISTDGRHRETDRDIIRAMQCSSDPRRRLLCGTST